jgi:hypothetical protein
MEETFTDRLADFVAFSAGRLQQQGHAHLLTRFGRPEGCV